MANLKPISQKQFKVTITSAATPNADATANSGSGTGSGNASGSGTQATASSVADFFFTKVTAPKETRETMDYNDGQTGTTYKMLGFTSRDNVTLSKPFNPSQDKQLAAWYNQQIASPSDFTVSIQPVNTDNGGTVIANAGTLQLLGCEVVSFKFPDVDRMGNSVATVELEIIYKSWKFS